MVQKIFQRVEKKYVITQRQYNQILKLASSYLKEDRYFNSTICNLYFDSINNDLIINSIEKPVYKEKIRLRSYGIPSLDSDVFFEVKKKYQGTVFKRRETLKLKDVYDYLDSGHYSHSQIMKEIDYCFQKYQLKPAIYIAYNRYAYVSKDDENFRITFDYRIRSRKKDLRLELGDDGHNLLDDGIYIMEVKSLGALPLWFCQILTNLQIYPTSFSKYGKIYEHNVLEGV